jgi:hypothetical protein
LDYKDIILQQIEEVKKKLKETTEENEIKYWNWVIQELINDYKTYIKQQYWYKLPKIYFIGNIDDLLDSLF